MQRIELRGHWYDVRDSFPGKSGWNEYMEIARLIPNKVEDLDYDNMTRFFCLTVMNWDREGAPGNPEQWEQLEAIERLLLVKRVNEVLSADVPEDQKN